MNLATASTPARSAAEEFRVTHAAYFFEDAHFLVEAEASRVASEVAPNVFVFSDGSRLTIDARSCRVTATPAQA